MLRRPTIAPAVRPNAAPIIRCGLPVATSSRSRFSSSAVHFLLLFFGMARWLSNGFNNQHLNAARSYRSHPREFFPAIDERNATLRDTFS
jgi:hypothetical protein